MQRWLEKGLTLEPGELVLWLVAPTVVQNHAADLPLGSLSEAEERRYASLVGSQLKQAFLGRRQVLRRLLGAYCRLAPERLDLVRQHGGKPTLAPEQTGPCFSTSSSDGFLLLAFCSEQPVGVDIERWRQDVGYEAIVARHFSARERSSLEGLDEAARLQRFFQVWTQKEAVLKLFGVGLDGLDALKSGAEGPERSWVEDLRLPCGFSGSVALPRPPIAMHVRGWGLEKDPQTEELSRLKPKREALV